MNKLKITVNNPSNTNVLRPVTGGIPIAEYDAPFGSIFGLKDSNENSVPCQSEVLGRWKDGSARWVLLDFQASPPAGGSEIYTLEWASGLPEVTLDIPVQAVGGMDFSISSGEVEIAPASDALLAVTGKCKVDFCVTDSNGIEFKAVLESVEVQTAGAMRGTLALSGSFRNSAGSRLFGFRMWVYIYAGLSKIQLEPMILMDAETGLLQKFREVRLEIVPISTSDAATIGGAPDGANGRLFQIDDQQYIVDGTQFTGTRAPGWAETGGVAVALRDFWQQWPKSLEVKDDTIILGLFPAFEEGVFDHMLDPWYKHDYLFEGDCYRMRTGQARRWQVWLDIDGDGVSLAQCANFPLVPAADPVYAAATGLFGDILPAGAPGMADYDNWSTALFENYEKAIQQSRDYGAMNWGDWFGERQCNWGNHEYDTPQQLLVQFGRTGDPKYLHTGANSARHISEVDVVNFLNPDLKDYFNNEIGITEGYPPRTGMVHEHSVGHVGGFHSVQTIRDLYIKLRIGNTDNPYLCLDPYNLGHIFTVGMMLSYFLTGDPWIKETLNRIGDNLAQLVEDREYLFKGHNHCGRTNGWGMLALAGCYEVEHNERYLKAMRTIADDALDEQDPNCGGWLYELSPGHCDCPSQIHVGEAAFITAVRINGLSQYYRLTNDERMPDSILRGVTHMNRDTWNEIQHGWRYTSCPATWKSVSSYGTNILALANSVRITGDEEHLRILRAAWKVLFEDLKTAQMTGPGVGKSVSITIYGCPETASLLARCDAAIL